MSVLRGDQARALFARVHPTPHRFTTQVSAPPTDPTAGLPAGRTGIRVGTPSDPFGECAAPEQGRPQTAPGGLDDGRCPQVPVVAVVTTGGERPVLAEAGSAFTDVLTVAVGVRTQTAMKAVAVQVSSTTATGIVRHVRATPGPVSVLYLIDTPPEICTQVQDLLGGTIPVVTEHHTQAVVVVSAALRALASRGAGVADSSLLVVGTEQNPVVAVLATALRVGTVVSWNPSDAEDFPLPVMCRRADVVVDLLGLVTPDSSGSSEGFRPAPVVRPDPVATVRALPHLLHQMGTDVGSDLLAACTATAATLPSPTPTAPTHDPSGAHAPLSPHPDTTAAVPGAQTPSSADQEETR